MARPRHIIRWCKLCNTTIRDQSWPHPICISCFEAATGTTPPKPPAASDVDEAAAEDEIDPVTQRLMDDALPRHGKRHCPVPFCGRIGYFKRMALCCELHGPFAGI